MTFQIQFNECERDKSLGQYFWFLDESEKSLTKTRFMGDSRQHVTGEAKAPMQTFCGMSVSYEELTQAWEDPKLSKSRRTKC
jgi:hypothetical protein